MQNLQVLATEALFYGSKFPAADEIDPVDWLARVKDLINRQENVPDDVIKVGYAASLFRRKAAVWWAEHLPNTRGLAELERIQRTWDGFQDAFKEEYFKQHQRIDASVNWITWGMNSQENSYEYLQRLNNAARVFNRLNKDVIVETTPEALVIPLHIPGNDANNQVRTARRDLDQAAKGVSATLIHQQCLAYRDAYMERHTSTMVLKVAQLGIRNPLMVPLFNQALQENWPILRVMTRARAMEMRREAPAKKTGKVHGVAAGEGPLCLPGNTEAAAMPLPESEEDDDAAVDALKTKKGKGKGKGKGKPPGLNKPKAKAAGGDPSPKNDKVCSWCTRKGHNGSECFAEKSAKKAAIQRVANPRGSEYLSSIRATGMNWLNPDFGVEDAMSRLPENY